MQVLVSCVAVIPLCGSCLPSLTLKQAEASEPKYERNVVGGGSWGINAVSPGGMAELEQPCCHGKHLGRT